MVSVKKLAFCGVNSALALIAFMLENLFPPLFIVGGRIGVANFFVLIAGITAGFWYGFAVLAVKAVLGSILTGNAGAILYSLPAGAVAYTLQMLLILFAPKISVIAASVLGGTINACLQNATFCLITRTPEYFVYTPYLALIGALGGAIVGATVFAVIKYLPKKILDINIKEEKF